MKAMKTTVPRCSEIFLLEKVPRCEQICSFLSNSEVLCRDTHTRHTILPPFAVHRNHINQIAR